MPLYMDHHKNLEGLTAEAVAEDHKKDLAVQDKHGAKALRYWFSEDKGEVYCLFEAPNAEAAEAVHRYRPTPRHLRSTTATDPRNTLATALDTALHEQSAGVCNRSPQLPAKGKKRIADNKSSRKPNIRYSLFATPLGTGPIGLRDRG